MNSCRSIEFWACAPPLITFIIGTGSVARLLAAEPAVERDARPRPRPPSRRRASTPRIAFAPSRPLFGVPSSSISALVERALVGRVEPGDARRRSRRSTFATACVTPLPPYAAPPSRSSTASCTPGRRARRHRGAAERARLERDVDLDGRVAARVEDLAARGRAAIALIGSASPWPDRSSGPARRAASSAQRPPLRRREPLGALDARRRSARVVARSASSGSTFSRRATLTAAKSTSPSSSTCARVGLASRAAGRSAGSSRRSSRSSSSRSASAPADVRVLEADRRRAALHLVRVEQRRQRLGHVVEDALALLLLGLELLPAARHARRRSRLGVAEHVRVPADELLVDRRARPSRGRPRRAPRAAARGSTSGRAGRRARRAASRRRRRAPRRRPRRPPRPCAGRSCAPVCSRSQGQSRRSRSVSAWSSTSASGQGVTRRPLTRWWWRRAGAVAGRRRRRSRPRRRLVAYDPSCSVLDPVGHRSFLLLLLGELLLGSRP